jgi:hypothetical protein
VFLEKAYLLQFSVISYSQCAKIYDLVDKVGKKLGAIDRIQKERQTKKDAINKKMVK